MSRQIWDYADKILAAENPPPKPSLIERIEESTGKTMEDLLRDDMWLGQAGRLSPQLADKFRELLQECIGEGLLDAPLCADCDEPADYEKPFPCKKCGGTTFKHGRGTMRGTMRMIAGKPQWEPEGGWDAE